MKTMSALQEIDIEQLQSFYIGHATDQAAATGCTAILAPEGAQAGVDVRGGGPATRELALLDARAMIQGVHAIMLSGGSAYGLDASSGAMQWLEEQGYGFETGWGKVPIVCAASLFDLVVGSSQVRPDKSMGYAACANAFARKESNASGNIGAGCGATVGKLAGPERMMKGGLGCLAMSVGALQVAVVVAVNALGNVYDHHSGELVAGLLSEDKSRIVDSGSLLLELSAAEANPFAADATTNTTIGCVLTNAHLTKAEAGKVAALAHDGLARAIFPVHTQADGDAMFCLASGQVPASVDLVGSIAAEVCARAITRAVQAAASAYGVLAAADFSGGQRK